MTEGADNRQQAAPPISEVGARAWLLAARAAAPAHWADRLASRPLLGAGTTDGATSAARYVMRWLDFQPAAMTLLRRFPEGDGEGPVADSGAWLRRAESMSASTWFSSPSDSAAAPSISEAGAQQHRPPVPAPPRPALASTPPVSAQAQRSPAPAPAEPRQPQVKPAPNSPEGQTASQAPATAGPELPRVQPQMPPTAHTGAIGPALPRAHLQPPAAYSGAAGPELPRVQPQMPPAAHTGAVGPESQPAPASRASRHSPVLAASGPPPALPLVLRSALDAAAAPAAAGTDTGHTTVSPRPLVGLSAPAHPGAAAAAQAASTSSSGATLPLLPQLAQRAGFALPTVTPESVATLPLTMRSPTAGSADAQPEQAARPIPPPSGAGALALRELRRPGDVPRAIAPAPASGGGPGATPTPPAGERLDEPAAHDAGPEQVAAAALTPPLLAPLLARAAFRPTAAPAPVRQRMPASGAPVARSANFSAAAYAPRGPALGDALAPAPLLMLRARHAGLEPEAAQEAGSEQGGALAALPRTTIVPAFGSAPEPVPGAQPAVVRRASIPGLGLPAFPAAPASGERPSDETTPPAPAATAVPGSRAAALGSAPLQLVRLAPLAVPGADRPAPATPGLAAETAASLVRRFTQPVTSTFSPAGEPTTQPGAPLAAGGGASAAGAVAAIPGDPQRSLSVVSTQPAASGAPLPLLRRSLATPPARPLDDAQLGSTLARESPWPSGASRSGPAARSGYPEPGSLVGVGPASTNGPAAHAAPSLDLLRPIAPLQRAPEAAAPLGPATDAASALIATSMSDTASAGQEGQGAPAIDIDAIAQKVYEQIRRRLRIDQERLGKY